MGSMYIETPNIYIYIFILFGPVKNSGLKEEFRYLEENITNDINKENNKYDH